MNFTSDLLIACALSIGAKISSRLSSSGLMITTKKRKHPHKFDPENSSEDAMMLAIHHQMDIFVGTYGAEVVCEKIGINSVFCENKDNPASAVRQAIASVAARIYLDSARSIREETK